jgi:hypothetical protein
LLAVIWTQQKQAAARASERLVLTEPSAVAPDPRVNFAIRLLRNLKLIVASGATALLETSCKWRKRTGSPRGQPAWGGGSDRVVLRPQVRGGETGPGRYRFRFRILRTKVSFGYLRVADEQSYSVL